jgi:6-phosphogluconolactonase
MKRVACAALLIAACGGSKPAMPQDAHLPASDAPSPAHVVAYISGYGPSIAWFDFAPATGTLTPVASIAAAQPQPSFLAITSTHLYAVSESASRVGAYAIDPATGALTFINDVASGGDGPAHVSVDRAGKYALVANYGGGTVAVLPIRADGGLDAARQTLAPGTNAHMIVADAGNAHVFVPCKGSDYVAQYTFDAATGTLAPNAVPELATDAGAGPRHLAFAPDGAHAYLIAENASTLTALAYDTATGRLTPLHTVSTRATGATGTNTGAEVWVHPSGKFVYGSNRGDDNIAVFAIDPATGRVTPTGHTPTGGHTPRDFALDPTGAWLVAANQDSNSVVTFAIDPTTGALAPTGAPLAMTMPSFVGFLALPAR